KARMSRATGRDTGHVCVMGQDQAPNPTQAREAWVGTPAASWLRGMTIFRTNKRGTAGSRPTKILQASSKPTRPTRASSQALRHRPRHDRVDEVGAVGCAHASDIVPSRTGNERAIQPEAKPVPTA